MTGVPHPSVDSALFYTHISSTDPEPVRARHLLFFCLDRATKLELEPPKSKSKSSKTRKLDTPRTEEGDRLLQDIMADFSRNLGAAKIETNVFGSGVRSRCQCGARKLTL
jgi:kinetochore protein Mis13/DSN1